MMRCAGRLLAQHQRREDQARQRRAGRLDGGAVAERHQHEAGIGDHGLRRAGEHVSTSPRPQPMPPRSPMPSRRHSGSSSRPAQKKRCNARSAGEKPMAMPCLAATKPAAQPSAAPMPHSDADQDAGRPCRRRLIAFIVHGSRAWSRYAGR